MQSSSNARRRCCSALLMALCVFATGSCGWRDQSPTASLQPPGDLAQHLTGEAALALNDRGEFTLPPAAAPGEVPIISEGRAKELAAATLRNWRSLLQRPMERDRGAPIDWNALRPGRTFFARTPYAPVPERYHPAHRHDFGPRYVILFLTGSEPVLVVSVAAYATEAWIDEQGRMLTPVQHGDEVSVFALSPSPSVGFGLQPNLPEHAAARLGRLTGARTARVPELTLRADPAGFRYESSLSLWKVQLDREIRVRRKAGPGQTERARDVYVGPNEKLFVPSQEQPARIEFTARLRQGPIGERLAERLSLPTLPPLQFDEVTLDQGGR